MGKVKALVFLIAISAILRAHLYTGSVTGAVTDPSGAVIPTARVTMVDQQKGYSFTTVTDGAGRYLFRNVQPGTYRIAVEAKAFVYRIETPAKAGLP
jgi:FlaG/FlaF family flagellin (archaellin)